MKKTLTDTALQNLKPISDEIVEAVCHILAQLHRLTDLGLDPRRIDRIRRETIFFLYEGGEPTKWSFDRPHSAGARALHREARLLGRTFNSKNYPITYEHAVPLATLREGLREAAGSPAEMSAFLERHVAGVAILKEENARLSKLRLRRSMPGGSLAHDRSPLATGPLASRSSRRMRQS